MPNRTVWVREDDLEAFEAIEQRPLWLHLAIALSKEIIESASESNE
jgi:hypothetical protein